MAYKTINISLPESMKTEVEREVAEGHFASTSDFIRDLIRDYLEDKRIERLVVEGLNDPDVSELKSEDFKEMKRVLRMRIARSKVDNGT
ncbi:MAG: ribbon-helix-helix protein, CopG family [Acidobacteriota bacterium]|nr:MAG: ribbon-helix-helix protein, CopG family [Acidobacteriota bacterium]